MEKPPVPGTWDHGLQEQREAFPKSCPLQEAVFLSSPEAPWGTAPYSMPTCHPTKPRTEPPDLPSVGGILLQVNLSLLLSQWFLRLSPLTVRLQRKRLLLGPLNYPACSCGLL